jgi:hypothetical protein
MHFDYAQDRGIGTAFSSSPAERLASGLERRLVDAVRARVSDLGGGCSGRDLVSLDYLIMPAMFTTRGGFGTHWMLPGNVRVHDPREPDVGKYWGYRSDHDLSGDDVRQLVLHCMFPLPGDSNEACRKVLENRIPSGWLADAESCSKISTQPHCTAGWGALRDELGMPSPTPALALPARWP